MTKLKGSIISPASSVPQDTARNPQHLQRDLVFQPQCSCSSLKLCFALRNRAISASTVEKRWKNEKSQWQYGLQLLCCVAEHAWCAFSTPCCSHAWLSERQTKKLQYTLSVGEVIIILLYLFPGFHPIHLHRKTKEPALISTTQVSFLG